jgi:hypothetical protein
MIRHLFRKLHGPLMKRYTHDIFTNLLPPITARGTSDELSEQKDRRYSVQHSQRTTETATEQPLLGSFIAIIAAAITGLIFGLLTKLSWQGCLMLMFAVAALGGGIVFTVLEMRSLVKDRK